MYKRERDRKEKRIKKKGTQEGEGGGICRNHALTTEDRAAQSFEHHTS